MTESYISPFIIVQEWPPSKPSQLKASLGSFHTKRPRREVKLKWLVRLVRDIHLITDRKVSSHMQPLFVRAAHARINITLLIEL